MLTPVVNLPSYTFQHTHNSTLLGQTTCAAGTNAVAPMMAGMEALN